MESTDSIIESEIFNETNESNDHNEQIEIIKSTYTNVILIDCNVKKYQTFVSCCNTNTLPIVYSYNTTRNDIVTQLSQILGINRIAICSDSATTLFLENEPFFNTNSIDFIVDLIKQYDISYIDYLACDTLNNSKWVNYFTSIMSFTNVIVGASNNATGNIQYGGDWIMENTCQNIENIYFTQNIQYYQYLLGNNFYKNTTDITTNFSSITQLTSFPTFNGTANFSTKFRIKQGGNDVDLALLYALNTVPTAGTYTTGMFGYSNGTKYDLSFFFAPIPVISNPITVSPTPNKYSDSNGTLYYFTNANATYTLSSSANKTAYILCYGAGGNGNRGISGNGGAGGGGGQVIYSTLSLISGTNYTISIPTPIAGTTTILTTTFTGGAITITANGGGGGASGTAVVANTNTTTGNTGTIVQYSGGNGGAGGNAGRVAGVNGTVITSSGIYTNMYTSITTNFSVSQITSGKGGAGAATQVGSGIGGFGFPNCIVNRTTAPIGLGDTGCGGGGGLNSVNGAFGGPGAIFLYIPN